jgi:hypothetical protein
MTKRLSNAGPATALSPYLSLREAVRPAIYAYGLLAREQEQATALAMEANNLLKATQELLEATGLVHILSPYPREEAVLGNDHDDRQARLVAAYSEAGMRWARIVGTCLALADALIAEARWTDARRLAAYLKAAREPSAAEDVVARIETAQRKAEADAFQARYAAFLRRLNDDMPPPDIQEALSIIRSARFDQSVLLETDKRLRKPVLMSIAKYVNNGRRKDEEYRQYGTPSITEEIRQLESLMDVWKKSYGQDQWQGMLDYFESLYARWG